MNLENTKIEFKSEEAFREFQFKALIRLDAKLMVLNDVVQQIVGKMNPPPYTESEYAEFAVKDMDYWVERNFNRYKEFLKHQPEAKKEW
jgi:hypothetical protein